MRARSHIKRSKIATTKTQQQKWEVNIHTQKRRKERKSPMS